MVYKTLGERIKGLRTLAKFNQNELAIAIGRTLKMISLYENDLKMPPANILQNIADKLNTTSDYLLTGNERFDTSGSSTILREDSEVYNFDGESIYIPIIYKMHDKSGIDKIADLHDGLILIDRTKLADSFDEYFALRFNTYFDNLHTDSQTIFIIHRQDMLNSGELGYIQYEGVPMIGRVFIGKSFTSILTGSMSEKRLEIPGRKLEDLIILGRVIFTIQEY